MSTTGTNLLIRRKPSMATLGDGSGEEIVGVSQPGSPPEIQEGLMFADRMACSLCPRFRTQAGKARYGQHKKERWAEHILPVLELNPVLV
jgi:hypothetical protein